MNTWPLRFRRLPGGPVLLADDAGGFFVSDQAFVDRYASGRLNADDLACLDEGGHTFHVTGDAAWTAFAYRWSKRQSRGTALSYLLLVPTLRCNLACGYCQVSRVAETARGFDWSQDTLEAVLRFLDNLQGTEIKIEFQGGEPLLRVDLLDTVRSFCRARFHGSEFVVCTNLQQLGEREWTFLDAQDTFVSTSLDGDRATHQRQRTHIPEATDLFLGNLSEALRRLGPGKLSALPTIDVNAPPDLNLLLDQFENFGLHSVYLRPINHQGFARKLKAASSENITRWNELHSGFIDLLIERNHRTGNFMEEYYFSQCVKRVLQLGADSHVDLRNPNLFATDYLVIDYDGRVYPTDEARMLTRVGVIDLGIGHVKEGLDRSKVDALNSCSLNNFDPDCIHCTYQPFCGTDVIDDLSRYGRVDLTRPDTWFCQRHLSIFDKVFEVLYREDQPARRSVASWLNLADWSPDMVARHR